MYERERLKCWVGRMGVLKVAHYQAYLYHHVFDTVAGCILIVLTSAAATWSLLSYMAPTIDTWIKYADVGVGFASAVFAGIQNLLRYSERAEKHRNSGANYAKLELKGEQLLAS